MSPKGLKQRFKLSRFITGDKHPVKQLLLNQRHVFILPTKRGFGFVALIILVLLIAFIYNNNLAYLLAFLLASIFFITILHTFKSLAGLILTMGQSKAVFAGDNAGFDVTIDNTRQHERYNLHIRLDKEIRFALNAKEKRRLTLYSKTHKRGWHAIDTVRISSTYPLVFFCAWTPIHFAAKTLVYPKPSTVEQPFPQADGEVLNGLNDASFNMGNDDFYGLKEYVPGDSIKHIHWKAFAKGQGLFSKQYEGGHSSVLWLDYEQTAGTHVEERLSQLCRWVMDAEKRGLQYGFKMPGIKLDPNQGARHYEKCLQAMALF